MNCATTNAHNLNPGNLLILKILVQTKNRGFKPLPQEKIQEFFLKLTPMGRDVIPAL